VYLEVSNFFDNDTLELNGRADSEKVYPGLLFTYDRGNTVKLGILGNVRAVINTTIDNGKKSYTTEPHSIQYIDLQIISGQALVRHGEEA
jgi:hypothetical protein